MTALTLPAGTVLHRLSAARYPVLRFSNERGGRFNPKLDRLGACYFATEPLGAFVEVMRHQLVTQADIDRRVLTSGRLLHDREVFDATTRGARFGSPAEVTAALSAGPHDAAREVATGLTEQFDGIRYRVRHDPRQELIGVALFGPVTETDIRTVLDDPRSGHIPAELVEMAVDEFGYLSMPEPPLLPE